MNLSPFYLFLRNRQVMWLPCALTLYAVLLLVLPVHNTAVPFRFDVANNVLVVVGLLPAIAVPYLSASPMPALEAAASGRVRTTWVLGLLLLHYLLWAAVAGALMWNPTFPVGLADQLVRNTTLAVGLGFLAMVWTPREVAWLPGTFALCVTWMFGTTGPEAASRVWSIATYPPHSILAWSVTAVIAGGALVSLSCARRTWGTPNFAQ